MQSSCTMLSTSSTGCIARSLLLPHALFDQANCNQVVTATRRAPPTGICLKRAPRLQRPSAHKKCGTGGSGPCSRRRMAPRLRPRHTTPKSLSPFLPLLPPPPAWLHLSRVYDLSRVYYVRIAATRGRAGEMRRSVSAKGGASERQ